MRYFMENASMKVEVESLGAELKSVLGKKSNIEYMWCSNPEYYKRSAPNLFPIVGKTESIIIRESLTRWDSTAMSVM